MILFKYIILEENNFPVFFPKDPYTHAEIAEKFGKVKNAGFCFFKPEGNFIKVICYGDSSTLNIKSNPEEDALFLEKLINNNCP